ncbi:tRNA nucleotidyltransferase [Fistulifera solaris]|uniref:tRNA nucleotidyltransferase n=1 Tax=Fistulifera solaris TaxID=1519565 RepID=A0A1Z5K8U2_FISSO|nr:tRNA nucleotidyltransferase [Fistulifera solaris]|eukprot:GAX22700.1 tRNA nucleotidyltransferase [Fistulifera solaris]
MVADSRELRLLGGILVHDMLQTSSMAAFQRTVGMSSEQSSYTMTMSRMDSVRFFSAAASASSSSHGSSKSNRPREGYGPSIHLTDEEKHLFNLLRHVREKTNLNTTLRVAGGWVRDKLLATPEFQTYHKVFDIGGNRLTSKFQKPAPSLGRQGTKVLVSTDESSNSPVDIDIALDDMLGREFADHLNEYLTSQGEDTVSVGVVLKNPEKSKHLETATMKVDSFWIDFVNLRAEEYTQDSRIPDLMRIGTAEEDAFRRDLTINALFYNINTGQVEDWTGRGFDDLRRGIVATPLAPLTTLLDDPLRVLRSIRFAARLRFGMDPELKASAMDDRVRTALGQKVSRERVGGEIDLMLRSPDPVGAMRLLINLKLVDTVFPISKYLCEYGGDDCADTTRRIFCKGLTLLSTAHDHLADCRLSPPLWCTAQNPIYDGGCRLVDDCESRRLLWYAAFLKPLWDETALWRKNAAAAPGARNKKSNRSIISKILVDELKRPTRDAESVEKILIASDQIAHLMGSGGDISATMILLSDVLVTSRGASADRDSTSVLCTMNGHKIDSATEEDPLWIHAMEFRQRCAKVLIKVGPLWRASLILAISEQLAALESDMSYAIEGDIVDDSQDEQRRGIIESFDAFAAAWQQLGLIGIWHQEPLLDGEAVKKLLPQIPRGPAFRDVMDEQANWMISHPGAGVSALESYLVASFPTFAPAVEDGAKQTHTKEQHQSRQ